jgi:hypothetical protein
MGAVTHQDRAKARSIGSLKYKNLKLKKKKKKMMMMMKKRSGDAQRTDS